MPATNDRHEISIAVKESDIDMMGHVNNVVFLRWVQDAAVAHWLAAASAAAQEELLRVVLRHEIDYKHPAKARTVWCPIDRKTGKPTDVSQDVRARFSTGGQKSIRVF